MDAIGAILSSLAAGAAGGQGGGGQAQGGQHAMETLMRNVPPEVRSSSTNATDHQTAIATWLLRGILRLLIDHFDAVGSSPAGDATISPLSRP